MVVVTRARPPRSGAGLAPVVLTVLLVGGLLVPAGRATAHGPPPADLVGAAVGAYPGPGMLAVAVGRQHTPVTWGSIPAAEARAAREAGYAADNGAVAERPFPAASMVKLFLAEDILHRA